MGEICYSCFAEKSTSGACPHCGYDPASDEGKYPIALRAGSILNGRYIVGRVLGQGGFGITYLAQDYQTKGLVAIKEYLPTEFAGRTTGTYAVQVYSGDRRENFEYGKEQFLAEAKTLAEFIGNDHIVRIYSYFEEYGTAYFAMEYIDGESLDDYISHHGGRLSVERANELLIPVMEALDWVHSKGIIHRDIAPDNIIVAKSGDAKLIDFGAARYSTGEKSKSLDVILKHGFAPKEQYIRRGRQGPFTDVYAMAATYYYAITGKVPPDAIERIDEDELIPPTTLGVRMSSSAEDALLKGLEVSVSDRLQSAGQLAAALAAAQPSRRVRPVMRTISRDFTHSAPVSVHEPAPAEEAPPVTPPQPVSQPEDRSAFTEEENSAVTAENTSGTSQDTLPVETASDPALTEDDVPDIIRKNQFAKKFSGKIKKKPAIIIAALLLLAVIAGIAAGSGLFSGSSVSGVALSDSDWSFDKSSGTLEIVCSGAIPDYNRLSDRPWDGIKGDVKKLVIYGDVTDIGKNAFAQFDSLKSVILPYSVGSLGSRAFSKCDSLTDIYFVGKKTQWNTKLEDAGKNNDALFNAVVHYVDPIFAPNLTVTGKTNQIHLSWSDVEGAEKYRIYRSTNGADFTLYKECMETEYFDDSPAKGVEYFYKVKAVTTVNGIDYASKSSDVDSIVSLTPPVLNVSGENGTVKLVWSEVAGITTYYIYRSTDGKNYEYCNSTTQNRYTDSSATPCKKYYYTVEANDPDDNEHYVGRFSNSESVVPISAPTLSVTKSGVRVKLSWNKIAGVTKYWVYRSTDGVNYEFYDKTYDTKYTNNSVYVGTRYYYKVKAVVTIDGEDYSSSHSNAVNIIP